MPLFFADYVIKKSEIREEQSDMSQRLQLIMIAIELLYFIAIIGLLKKKKLVLSYSLLWIFSGIVLLVLTIFPNLLNIIFGIVAIESPMNGLLSLCIFCILIILISITSIVSMQSKKIRELTQDNAILAKRISELEDKLND